MTSPRKVTYKDRLVWATAALRRHATLSPAARGIRATLPKANSFFLPPANAVREVGFWNDMTHTGWLRIDL